MIFIHFIAVPSPKMLNLQVTVLWLCCELQEQGWCSGEINCSQSTIFPRDRRDWALCVTGCHLAWVSKLFMGQGRSLTTHQCGLGSNPGIDAMWLSLLLVLSLSFSERFFSGFSSFHLSLKTNTFKNPIWSGMHRHVSTSWEQQRTPKCTVGKQIILHFLTIWWPVSHSHELTILISHSFSKSHSPINFWSRYRVCVQVRYIDIVNSIQRKHLMISFDYLVVKAWIA